jgi:hypothetical protein
LMADYRYGVLQDQKTLCSTLDTPQQPGCTIINSSGASIQGFTLYGRGAAAGGADVGIRVFANNVHVQDTNSGFFGGPGIQTYGGINNSFDWNFGTNVDSWWCANPSQLTSDLGGMDLQMIDGEASNNQYSTGCSFTKSFSVSAEYPHLASMVVGGAGDLIQSNLLQVDGIGLIVDGFDNRIVSNRVEYQAREAIRVTGHSNTFANNRITSACLDPNLINLRPGSFDNGVPLYPGTPTFLHTGYIVMDLNGNMEQVIGNAGTSDKNIPDWSIQVGGTVDTGQLIWENIGPWKPGLTDVTDSGSVPSVVSGLCYAVLDIGGGGDTWNANDVVQEVGVNGPSYLRGSYNIASLAGAITGNTCDGDLPDPYGNGQCWWGGDLFANGGPAYLAPNGKQVSTSGGGTAWVGDYSVLVLADNISRHYNNFQGMSQGQVFSVTSSTVANVIDPWGISSSNWNIMGPGGVYGHPSLQTCTGGPLVVTPGSYYQFYYFLSSTDTDYAIQQINCPSGPTTGANSAFTSILPGSLTFASQIDGTTSAAQTVTVSNTSGTTLNVVFAVSDDFSQTNTCGGSMAVGASCTVSLLFTPTTGGAHIGVLSVTDSETGSSQTVTLSGAGTAPLSGTSQPTGVVAITLASSVSNLEISTTGQNATTKLTVTPEDGFVGTVNLKCQITSESQTVQSMAPTCSLSPARVDIDSNVAGVSTLVISATSSSIANTRDLSPYYRGASFAELSLLGLLPFSRLRRKTWALCLSMMLLSGVIGCGYTPNSSTTSFSSTTSYTVLITATSGATTNTSISLPLKVQVQ